MERWLMKDYLAPPGDGTMILKGTEVKVLLLTVAEDDVVYAWVELVQGGGNYKVPLSILSKDY